MKQGGLSSSLKKGSTLHVGESVIYIEDICFDNRGGAYVKVRTVAPKKVIIHATSPYYHSTRTDELDNFGNQ